MKKPVRTTIYRKIQGKQNKLDNRFQHMYDMQKYSIHSMRQWKDMFRDQVGSAGLAVLRVNRRDTQNGRAGSIAPFCYLCLQTPL